MKHVTLIVAAVALSAAVSGCAKARAAGVLEGPPLAMPAPPPRELGPIEADLLPTTMNGPDRPVAAAPRISPAPLPPRRQPATRQEPEARTEPPAAASVTSPVAPVEPPRELRAVQPSESATDTAAVMTRVRNYLSQAAADRSRVVYAKLSAVSKQNYDESKRHSEEADKKLKERNLTGAESAAEKAATLAAFLTR